MNNNLIITIGREYGTGGREIGQKLALRQIGRASCRERV